MIHLASPPVAPPPPLPLPPRRPVLPNAYDRLVAMREGGELAPAAQPLAGLQLQQRPRCPYAVRSSQRTCAKAEAGPRRARASRSVAQRRPRPRLPQSSLIQIHWSQSHFQHCGALSWREKRTLPRHQMPMPPLMRRAAGQAETVPIEGSDEVQLGRGRRFHQGRSCDWLPHLTDPVRRPSAQDRSHRARTPPPESHRQLALPDGFPCYSCRCSAVQRVSSLSTVPQR
mmetsp:Transcript_933/g.3203  ORF Transcript_933/g.3203 Transcript_933/m.3203 type:complete len:228 (-) Transcript_933:973-1656(-)